MKGGKITKISIAEVFSMYPAGRFRQDGKYNGTEFRDTHLVPRLRDLTGSDRLEVSLDGVAGVGSSFLEEAFGGLVRAGYRKEFLQRHLQVTAKDEALRDFAELAMVHISEASEPAERV
ncbi:STAS-like domain-containing protein [Candidatus Foliamicus sp.]